MTDELGLICAFSHRRPGNMSLSYGDTGSSLAHRKEFLEFLGINWRDLVCAKQVHSHRIQYVTEKDKGKGAKVYTDAIADTDALMTDKKGVPLAIFTADCLPIFLYDPGRPAIGLVHAGWRSTKDGVASGAVQLMQKLFKTDAAALRAGFGPSIRSCCYEVSKDFRGYFPGEVIERDNRYFLDLAQINKKQLCGLGVKEEHIFDSRICTFCRNEEFFSYRKEGEACGRLMSVAMLK